MTEDCSVLELQLAIAGSLPPDREEQLHRHLEHCEACSAAIEEMAGVNPWCDEAASLLRTDELDLAVPKREEWSEVDFTVEHLEPSDQPNVLGRLGGYDVLEIIGRGGMGVVLKGFDRELNRYIAIKVLAPHLAQSSLAKKRFIREAQAAAAVVHPHVMAIHQVQPGGRLPFLVMPLVAGESLAQRLIAQGRLELKETLRIGMQAAAGLAAAHEQGLVHRDVKPANILLEKGVERAVLTDFGLARAADDVSMTRWGVIAGTPQYMSPEQARGEPLDGRSDLFSLGCVLYEMATGVSPFRADSTMATLRRLVDDPPPAMASLNPELPPWFVAIVDCLLEKDPAQRYASAKEVSELLERCLAHVQQPTSVPLPAEFANPAPHPQPKPRKSRFRGVAIMLSLVGIGLFAAAIVATNPPDISGQWEGESWDQIVLTPTAPGEYAGTYSGTVAKRPGKVQLKWSRIQRRFNGTWREGDDCFGELSIRLVDREIRGALTTDPKSKISPATPRLADLLWTRVAAETRHANPRLRVLDANGSSVGGNGVIRGRKGYPGPVLPSWPETPSQFDSISLAKLPAGTHWLLVRGDPPTVLRLELPAAEETIERRLRSRPGLIGKNLDAKLAVEVNGGAEIIRIEIQNRTTQAIKLTEANLDLLTAIKGPGADAHVLSPLWTMLVGGDALPETTIEPGQTATLRLNWAHWVKHGFWFSRDGEVITEPTFPEFEAGKTWVRVAPFSALPVSVTHPDKIEAKADRAWTDQTEEMKKEMRGVRVAGGPEEGIQWNDGVRANLHTIEWDLQRLKGLVDSQNPVNE
jgi:serine/threonine-protein kinase